MCDNIKASNDSGKRVYDYTTLECEHLLDFLIFFSGTLSFIFQSMLCTSQLQVECTDHEQFFFSYNWFA